MAPPPGVSGQKGSRSHLPPLHCVPSVVSSYQDDGVVVAAVCCCNLLHSLVQIPVMAAPAVGDRQAKKRRLIFPTRISGEVGKVQRGMGTCEEGKLTGW